MCIRDKAVSVIAWILQSKHMRLHMLGSISLVVIGLFTLLLFTPIVYLVYVAPVSYTHLDVYKRQLLISLFSTSCMNSEYPTSLSTVGVPPSEDTRKNTSNSNKS